MEYNVLNSGELVLSSQPRYHPESIPHNRQNTKVVLLPVPYQGAGAPEAYYHNPRQAPYQSFAEVPYRNLPASSYQALQTRTFQAQNLPEATYQNLQTPPHRSLQAQSLPAPVHQSIEDMFSMSTLVGSTTCAGNEMLAGQDTRQSEENFDIDMAAPVLPEAVEGMFTDTIMPTVMETPPGTVCRSCDSLKSSLEELLSFCRRSIEELSSSYRSSIDELSSYRSSIEELSSSQRRSGEKVDNIGRAWSRFAEDVTSDMDENKQWRISIEEKIERLLEDRAADEASDYCS